MDPIYGYQVVNVEAQLSDQSSLLHWTRNMIALRKLFQVFGRGTLSFLNPANRKILAYLRDLDRGDGTHETVLCVANLSRFAQPVQLDLAGHAGLEPVEMLGYVPFPTIDTTPYALTLAPYSFLWLELQPASVKATPAEEPQLENVPAVAENEVAALDMLTKGWSGLLAGHGLALLESSLPAWLPRQRWFGAKSRTIQSIKVLDWVELPSATAANTAILPTADLPSASTLPAALLFFEIYYSDGPPDTYQLPLAFTTGPEAEHLIANHAASILATLATPTGPAVLHDATIREDLRQAMLTLIERNGTLELSNNRTAALEIAASLTAASSGHTANEAIVTGEAAALLDHPERATHSSATGSGVHLRPHEIFPAVRPEAGVTAANAFTSSNANDTASTGSSSASQSVPAGQDFNTPAPQQATGLPITPSPLTAQPGEAATPPKSGPPSNISSSSQQLQPRESPSAGDPIPLAGRLEARASTALTPELTGHRLASRLGSAEQSNTSILYGKQLIMKLFRRLQPGSNPGRRNRALPYRSSTFPPYCSFHGRDHRHSPERRKNHRRHVARLGSKRGRWMGMVPERARWLLPGHRRSAGSSRNFDSKLHRRSRIVPRGARVCWPGRRGRGIAWPPHRRNASGSRHANRRSRLCVRANHRGRPQQRRSQD